MYKNSPKGSLLTMIHTLVLQGKHLEDSELQGDKRIYPAIFHFYKLTVNSQTYVQIQNKFLHRKW